MHRIRPMGRRLCARGFDRQVARFEIRVAVPDGSTAPGMPVPDAVGEVCPGKREPRLSPDFCSSAVAESGVPVGTVSGIEGYGSVHVRTAEIAALFRNPQHVGLAPSAFGVSAGVKTGGAIQSLIGQGYMTVTDVPDARTGVVHQRVLDADTESFHARFLTWRTGAAETGISSRELQSLARAHSVTPFDTPRGSIAGVFHRQEMLASIRADHGAED